MYVGPGRSGDVPASPTDDVRALVDAADEAGSPEEQFRLVDLHRVWSAYEIQSLARLARAALGWTEAPFAQRVHAMATYAEGLGRFRQTGELEEVGGLARPMALPASSAWRRRCSGG